MITCRLLVAVHFLYIYIVYIYTIRPLRDPPAHPKIKQHDTNCKVHKYFVLKYNYCIVGIIFTLGGLIGKTNLLLVK